MTNNEDKKYTIHAVDSEQVKMEENELEMVYDKLCTIESQIWSLKSYRKLSPTSSERLEMIDYNLYRMQYYMKRAMQALEEDEEANPYT